MIATRRRLGTTSVEISPIVFGAWAIGGWMWGGTNEKDAIDAIVKSIANGINTIDTAAIYGMGLSEEIVGKAIAGNRDNVIIATKCGMRWNSSEGSDPWPQKDLKGSSIIIRKNSKPDSIFYEWEQSAKRLRTDFIDLYQIHWPDSTTPIEDSWNAMVKLKREGKVRAIGVSNYSLEQLRTAHAIHPVDSIQPPYSLIRRDIEKDIVPFCIKENISILAYSPLERGLLTGKITPDYKFPEGDHRAMSDAFSVENRKKILYALEKIKPIAKKHTASLLQIIISCTIHGPGITAAIVGARNVPQAEENAKALMIELSDEEKQFVLQVLQEISLK